MAGYGDGAGPAVVAARSSAHFVEERRDPRLRRVAGVDDDQVLELERLALREPQARVVEPVEGRGGEEAVVPGEPLRRVPAVPRAVEDREALGQAEARPRDVAPGRARPERALLAERAGGVPQDAARLGGQLGCDTGGEERVVGPLDPHLGLRDEDDLEAESPQRRGRRLDADLAPVDEDRGGAGLAPLALVRDHHAVGAGVDDGRPPRDDLALVVALLPVVPAVHLVAAEEERAVVGPGQRRLRGHRDARPRAVHRVEVGVLLARPEAVAGEGPVVDPHDEPVVEALDREAGGGRRGLRRGGLRSGACEASATGTSDASDTIACTPTPSARVDRRRCPMDAYLVTTGVSFRGIRTVPPKRRTCGPRRATRESSCDGSGTGRPKTDGRRPGAYVQPDCNPAISRHFRVARPLLLAERHRGEPAWTDRWTRPSFAPAAAGAG